jgi:hypothetical protein
MTDGWVTGKENVLEYCKKHFGFHSWQSVRYWRKKYALPVKYLPNGKPFIIVPEIIFWANRYYEIKKSEK